MCFLFLFVYNNLWHSANIVATFQMFMQTWFVSACVYYYWKHLNIIIISFLPVTVVNLLCWYLPFLITFTQILPALLESRVVVVFFVLIEHTAAWTWVLKTWRNACAFSLCKIINILVMGVYFNTYKIMFLFFFTHSYRCMLANLYLLCNCSFKFCLFFVYYVTTSIILTPQYLQCLYYLVPTV